MTFKRESPIDRNIRMERMQNRQRIIQEAQERAAQYPRIIYENYQKHIDTAIDNAFQNIMWIGSPADHLQNISGNSVIFPIGNMYLVMATIGLVQLKPDLFGWKVIVSIIVNKTKAIHKERFWTRKHRQIIMNIGKAFFQGCGTTDRMSFEIKNSILVGWKKPSEEDAKVILLAKAEHDEQVLKLMEKTIAQTPTTRPASSDALAGDSSN